MSKKVLVLPGSSWQIPIIEKTKKMGYEVVNINPYDDSPAFEYSDYIIKRDIMDVENCMKDAKNYDVVAVISDECDIATPIVAKMAEKLNVSGIGEDKASLFTNKYMMREFLEANGFAYPKYCLTQRKEEAISFFEKLNRKMIIKPLDSNSSRGVHTIRDVKELEEKFDDALSYSICDKMVICEEYIDGTEFTVDGIMTKAGHSTLAISEKKHYAYNENIAYSLRFSYVNENFDYDLLRKTNDDILNKTQLPFGLTHVEYKFKDGKYYLIEMGARGGGNLISADIVPIMSGIDNYEIYINMAIGKENNELFEIPAEYKNRQAILYFFDLPDGVEGEHAIKDVKGIDYLQNSKNVLKYAINFEIGDKIHRAENDSKRIGYYIAYGESKEELEKVMEEIDNRFQLIFED